MGVVRKLAPGARFFLDFVDFLWYTITIESFFQEEHMIQAFLFDFDGTIADTIPVLREAVNMTMEQYGYPLHSNEDILRFINNGARELIRRAMPADLQEDQELVDRVLADYSGHYRKVYHHTERAYDGVAELIARLHNEGFRIGVLSNKQDDILRKLTAQILLPGSYDGAQGVITGKPTKPHPYLVEKLAADLGVPPEACVMIGDSDVDFYTAQNAGMRHVGVTWGFRDEAFLRERGATLFAHDPDELLQILYQLNEN